MKLYKIRNWNLLYENNRTRELKKLDWFPMPNKQDGDGYTAIMERLDGAAIFGAWVACAQIASRCDPRGTLLRDGAKPHDSASLGRMSRIAPKIIQAMLDLLSSPDINWLETIDYECECENPALSCENPATGCLEGNGREGNEEKRMERAYSPQSRAALHYLNEKTGHHFRESESSLGPINQRLKLEGVTIEGVKEMIDTKVAEWQTDPKMKTFLRPETLFGKEKFESYYAQRKSTLKPGSRPLRPGIDFAP